ncbi:low temperature requirement protein A [Staphylococcus edaphicus]|uniref:Low temperature requirement protein A n=2 Tax=Staphylococcus edaphicus TaxID=1955013 RepID=A0A2C6U3L4_9STAP|nr:low temperature requirement protein A [Staphylococcus edaphicus]PHK48472.1 low temperature requirement protein LtrA [Staphylococcus edaphicus]UQW81485.1 low temperature requirement protein A [Staphylococcus edaphicus]
MEVESKKEVSMTELFFDLVFVYVLSSINHTVEEISHNLMSLEELGKSFMMFLVFFSIWIYRTLLVNRFFSKKWYQYLFVFIDMFLIIILSRAINGNFQETFTPFVVMTSLIYLSIFIQYFINYKLTHSQVDFNLVKVYTSGLLLSIILSLASLFIASPINFWIYFIAIVIVAVFPLIFYSVSNRNAVFFNHLTERLSLLVILLFGEGIVLLIQNIELAHLNFTYVLYFIFITCLFLIYVFHYKETDKKTDNHTGFTTIYTHLFLIFSLDTLFLVMNKSLLHHLSIIESIGAPMFFIIFILCITINIYLHKPKSSNA